MRKYYKILFDRIDYHDFNFHLEPLELNFVVARYILLVTVVQHIKSPGYYILISEGARSVMAGIARR